MLPLQNILVYRWLEDSLRLGKKVSEDSYLLMEDSACRKVAHQSSENVFEVKNANDSLVIIWVSEVTNLINNH